MRTYTVTMENTCGELDRQTFVIDAAMDDQTNRGGKHAAQILADMLAECRYLDHGDTFRVTVTGA